MAGRVLSWGEKRLQAGAFLVCLVVWLIQLDALSASEFSHGRVTGMLVGIADEGFNLLLVAFFATFFLPRVGAMLGLAGALATLPVNLYLVVPGVYQSVLGGEWKSPAVWYAVHFGALPWLIPTAAITLLARHMLRGNPAPHPGAEA